jgi:hypothetical protein
MSESLLPPRFLFLFAAPCLFSDAKWTAAGISLGEEHRLPNFAELDGRRSFADVRVAWSEAGLAFWMKVEGKRQTPWCRDSQVDASDGLHVWLDTRDTHNIHRASRFCHRFAFLPSGGGRSREDAFAGQLLINRAREHPKPAGAAYLKIRSERRVDGYLLQAFLHASALTGFEPTEHPKLGFNYAVIDREFGEQTFTAGGEFPYQEDPSLWGTLEMVR